jgi:nucleosome assembly protein 1-like 1
MPDENELSKEIKEPADDDEMPEKDPGELMDEDFDMGTEFKDQLIPLALEYYLEVIEADEEDDGEGCDDEDCDDDHHHGGHGHKGGDKDSDDEDEDKPAKGGKKAKKAGKAPEAGAPANKEDCKQQ